MIELTNSGLPSHEGSGLKWEHALNDKIGASLPSHEGSGLKLVGCTVSSGGTWSPLA